MCLFCKIVSREIISKIIYEDDYVVAFEDINPCAPVHVLVIPKDHISTLNDINGENEFIIGKIYLAISKLAKMLKISESGYRVVANCNEDGGQEIFHIHFHLIGGKECTWPPI